MLFKEYHKPATIDEAVALLQRKTPRTAVLSGGTWLNGEAPPDVEAVVDIGQLGLGTIQRQDNPPVLAIGATVTLETLAESLWDMPGLAVIAETAYAMAALNVRNQATIGGAIVTADSASPLVTALLACDAELDVHAAKRQTLPLTTFLSVSERVIADGVLITAVRLPIPGSESRAVYERVARTPRDYPIVCTVVRCSQRDGVISDLQIAVGGVAPAPVRLNALESALDQKTLLGNLDTHLSAAIAKLRPTSDYLGSSEYRSHVAGVLVRRALLKAANQLPA